MTSHDPRLDEGRAALIAQLDERFVPRELPWEHASHPTVLTAFAEIDDDAPATGIRRVWAALMALYP
jgi:hypothetical protein